MTSRSVAQQMRDVQVALDELRLDYEDWARDRARRRLEAGERKWSDLRLLGDDSRQRWRGMLMARVPAAVLRRRSPESPRGPQYPWSTFADLLAHLPEEPLPEPCERLITGATDGWRSPEFDLCMMWAQVRLMLGDDGGAALRDRCWKPVPEGWRPSAALVRAVQAHGSSADVHALDTMTKPYVHTDGAVYRLVVIPGGRLLATPAEGGQ